MVPKHWAMSNLEVVSAFYRSLGMPGVIPAFCFEVCFYAYGLLFCAAVGGGGLWWHFGFGYGGIVACGLGMVVG